MTDLKIAEAMLHAAGRIQERGHIFCSSTGHGIMLICHRPVLCLIKALQALGTAHHHGVIRVLAQGKQVLHRHLRAGHASSRDIAAQARHIPSFRQISAEMHTLRQREHTMWARCTPMQRADCRTQTFADRLRPWESPREGSGHAWRLCPSPCR